jgi:hypothetical protein
MALVGAKPAPELISSGSRDCRSGSLDCVSEEPFCVRARNLFKELPLCVAAEPGRCPLIESLILLQISEPLYWTGVDILHINKASDDLDTASIAPTRRRRSDYRMKDVQKPDHVSLGTLVNYLRDRLGKKVR